MIWMIPKQRSTDTQRMDACTRQDAIWSIIASVAKSSHVDEEVTFRMDEAGLLCSTGDRFVCDDKDDLDVLWRVAMGCNVVETANTRFNSPMDIRKILMSALRIDAEAADRLIVHFIVDHAPQP